MAHCIVTTSQDYIDLKNSLPNISERFLKAAIGLWQEQNSLESWPTKDQLVEFLNVKTKKTKEVPSKFEYEDRVSYINALLEWETNRGIFYRQTKQQAEDLKKSLSTSINPQNISIFPIKSKEGQLYKVIVKKPQIESKIEQQNRLVDTRDNEILTWWNNLTPEQRQSELTILENMSDDEIDYNNLIDESKLYPSIDLYDNMEDKPIKDESDVFSTLQTFGIANSNNTILSIPALVDFNGIFIQHFDKGLVELGENGVLQVSKDILNKYNESTLQSIIKADLDIIFSKKIKGYDERESTNDVIVDLEEMFTMDEDFKSLVTDESKRKYQVAINSARFKIDNFRKRLAKVYSDIETTAKQIIELQNNNESTVNLQTKLKTLQDKQISLQTLIEEQENFISDLKKSRETNSLIVFFDMAERELEQLKTLSEKSELTADEIDQAERIYSLWSAVGDRTLNRNTNSHPIFTKKELENDEMFYGFKDITGKDHKGFANIKEEMGRYMNTISDIKANMVVEAVKKELHQDGITKESLLKAIKDVPYIKALSYSISRVDDELMLSIYKMMRTAIIKVRTEGQERMNSLDEKIKAVEDQFGKDWMDMFIQKFEDGKKTGDLVDMYIPEYFKQKAKEYLTAREKEDYGHYLKFIRDNETLMDINILFPELEGNYNEDVQNAYIDSIKKQIGEYNFEYLYKMQERLIEKYKAAKFAKFQFIDSSDIDTESKEAQKRAWEYWNSPYKFTERLNTNKLSFTDGMYSKYNVSIVTNSKWYDPNYTKVISNKVTADLYSEITSLLRDLKYMIPENERSTVKRNTLPDIRKKIIGSMFNGNSTFGMEYLLNKVVDLTTQDTSIKGGLREEKDIVTGKVIRSVRTPSVGNRENIIKTYIKEKILEYRTENNVDPTDEQKYQWRIEAIKQIAEEKSYDLGNILKLYMVQVLSYKHKSDVENLVNFSAQLMIGRNQKLVDSAGNIQEIQGTKQLTEMLEYALDVWKGYPTKAVEGETNVKLLTNAERKKKRDYSYLLDKMRLKLQTLEDNNAPQSEIDELNKDIADVEEKMQSLGSNVTGSQVADAAMSWYTLLGMGWNAIAGVVNLAIGFLENTVRAADGRYFTTKDLFNSYMQTFSLIGKKVASTSEGRKIYNFNKKFDIVNKAINELYNFENNDWVTFIRKKAVLLNPMLINEVTELQNQMPIVRAYLLHKKAFDSNGNETNYWDSFNEDMTIKEGYRLSDKVSNEDALVDMELALRDLIKRSHGDYDQHNAKLYKRHALSRAIYQFRGWMPEGIASRFGKEEEINLLGEKVKGRYRSYAQIFKSTTVGDIHYSALNNVLFSMKQLLRKMLFQKTQFNDRMSEVDAANMRANLQELFILISTASLTLMLTSLVPDTDDRKRYRINILLNVLQRTQTDILMYINPSQYQNISKSFVPVTGLITNTTQAMNAIYSFMKDDSDANYEKLMKGIGKNIPGWTQGLRFKMYTEQVF